MNKIPTSEEFLDNEHDIHANKTWMTLVEKLEQYDLKSFCERMMQEFAKRHVQAALEAAAKEAYVNHEFSHMGCDYRIDKESILNAYPLENIK